MKKFPLLLLIGLAVAVFATLASLRSFIVDWLWFGALGFSAVFATVWHTEVVLFASVFIVSSVLLIINVWIATRANGDGFRRSGPIGDHARGASGLSDIIEILPPNFAWRGIATAIAIVVSFFLALSQVENWDLILKWAFAVPFGKVDPLFGNDLGFYIFTVPLYEAVRDWFASILFLATIMALLLHWSRGDILFRQQQPPVLSSTAIRHLSGLLALYFLSKTGSYWLQRYSLLSANSGVVFGAAYTDVHIRLPLLIALTMAALLGAVLCTANVRQGTYRLPIGSIILLVTLSLVTSVAPTLFQSYWVKPDELKLESRYIASNIEFTRYGFGLDHITSAPFPAKGKLTQEVIAANQATIQNIRWWDPRPLLDTYRQLQEIRLYYDFHDIDVDRYTIDGNYRQVLLSARELNQSKLPADAQTWINQRFKFTKGCRFFTSKIFPP